MLEQGDAIKTFIQSQISSSIEPAVEKAVREIFGPATERLAKDLVEISDRIEALESQPVTPQGPGLVVWNKGDSTGDERTQGLVIVDRETGKEETAEDLEKRWSEIEAELKALPAGDQRREELELEGFKIAPKLRELRGSQS
jgi:hypothetical protein